MDSPLNHQHLTSDVQKEYAHRYTTGDRSILSNHEDGTEIITYVLPTFW